MEVYFTPEKKWWQFWISKKPMKLKEGLDYWKLNGTVTFASQRGGEYKITYQYES